MRLGVEAVATRAREIGFLACGVAQLGPSQRAAALDDWLARGYAGTMRYLHRQAKKRKNPALIVRGAKVAVVVLENYLPRSGPTVRPSGRPSVSLAKYAQGADYHVVMMRRLEALAGFLLEHGATMARPWVDSGPVPERELAERAGLGWIGKNTMLIRPGVGSFFFIGTVFTDLALEPAVPMATDHCGTCTRCLDACPTRALVAPRLLDATRCISYLTIEQKRPIPEDMAAQLGGWTFGCDVCNDVCPWNERFAVATPRPEYQRRSDPDEANPEYFERMDAGEFEARFGDTPLARPGLERMRRNWRAAWGSLAERQGRCS